MEMTNPITMSREITFSGYGLSLIVVADGDYYEPTLLLASEDKDKKVFKSDKFQRGGEVKEASLNLELYRLPRGIGWKCTVEGFKSMYGVRFSLKYLPVGKVAVPVPGGLDVELEDEGVYNFTLGSARFAIFECPDKTLWIRANERPFRLNRIWVNRTGQKMVLDTYSEENAWERAENYSSPLWVLEEVGGWKSAVEEYRLWMEKTYGLKTFEQREDVPNWAKEIALYVNIYAHTYTNRIHYTFSDISNVLGEVAKRFPARNTLVYLAGWDGRIDMTYPEYKPSKDVGGEEGLKSLIDKAHSLGFKMMLHFNMWGVGYNSPLYEKFKEHRVRDSEGRALGWSFDHNKDGVTEDLFAYVSLDHKDFRELLLEKISAIVEKYGIDAVHLDQSAAYINDPRHDTFRGFKLLVEEVKRRFPSLLIEGEGIDERTVALTPIYHVWARGDKKHPVFRELFNVYAKPVGHMDMPSIAYKKRYRRSQDLYDFLGVIPSLGLNSTYPATAGAGLGEPPPMPNLDCEEARTTFERAKRYLEKIKGVGSL